MIEFKTKKALGEYVSAWLKTRIGQSYTPGCPEFDFLMSLLSRHPNLTEKSAQGIVGFRVRLNSFGNGVATDLQNDLGHWVDFSWRVCVTMCRKTNRLSTAFRVAIEEQIQDFRRMAPKLCSVCGIQDAAYDVDHKTPFKELYEQFLQAHPEFILPEAFEDCPATHRARFKPIDWKLESAWREFHQKHAELQFLCKLCHIAKTNHSDPAYRRR